MLLFGGNTLINNPVLVFRGQKRSLPIVHAQNPKVPDTG